MWYSYERKPLIGEQRVRAQNEIAKRRKQGKTLNPITIDGKKIVTQFWGKAWCEHLKNHCDLYNRLDRGRSYVTNGFVIHFELHEGYVRAQVSGSRVYDVEVQINRLAPPHWHQIKRRTAGQMGSLVELLQGKLSDAVMRVITHPEEGLFPKQMEMTFKCSCPDAGGGGWMCKHIAATLYAVGAKVDSSPELLFKLRGVGHLDLIESATANATTLATDAAATIAADDLPAIFGIDLGEPEPPAVVVRRAAKKKKVTKKAVRRKPLPKAKRATRKKS